MRLDSASPQLLEGVLELTVLDDLNTSFVYRTQELALITGARELRLLLPPARMERGMERDVRMRFIFTTGGVIELGKTALHPSLLMERSLVLAVGRVDLRAPEPGARLWQSLRLDRFEPAKGSSSMEKFSTTPVMIEPDDFPAEPLGYCAFDAVMIESRAFAALKEKPREALGQWLAGGGSVCVVANDPLDAAHAGTLRAWLRRDPSITLPEFDAEGRVQTTGDSAILARVGFGRLVVLTRAPDEIVDDPKWRRAITFLWKIRAVQASAIERDGAWQNEAFGKVGEWKNADRARRAQIASELTEALLPKTVRIIPLPVILAILIGFIAAVGPVDFFVLGKLRARRFTWLAFPLVSVGFTVLTMKLAAHYLGTNTHQAALVLTDLGPDGAVIRETRWELVLPAATQELVRDTQHAFAIPAAQNRDYGASADRVAIAGFEGQYPARYRLRLPLAQWAPQTIRVSALATGTDDSRVDWSAFPGAIGGGSGCAIWISDKGHHGYVGNAGPLSPDFLARITFTPEWNALFSAPSPGGAGSLDDLCVVEQNEPNRAVVVAVRREGADIHAWRRLYFRP